MKTTTMRCLMGFLWALYSSSLATAQCPVASNDVTISCGNSTTLNAGTPVANYTTSAATTTPLLTPPTWTTVTTLTDDSNTAALNIGFTFNFYGTNYTQFHIGSNGFITFGSGSTARASNTIPSTVAPNNVIAVALTDLNPECAGAVIRYGIMGTAPNRRMVISFENIRRFGCGNPAITFQIVLNENQSFDIIYGSIPAGFGTATAGAENGTGNLGVAIPGMNNQAFPTIITPTQYHFTPNPNATFVNWTANGQVVGTNNQLTVSPTSTTTYTANWNTGNGTTCQDNVVVTVQTGITADPVVNLCSGAQVPLSVTSYCYENNMGGLISVGGTFNQGSTSASSPTYRRPQGWLPCELNANANFYYHVFQFSVSVAGSYTLNNCAPNVDAHAALYQNVFDPTNPCGNTNFIVANDDGSSLNCGSDPQLVANLTPGVPYYIVTTTWSAGTTIPNFSWTFSNGPTGASIIPNAVTAMPANWYTSATANTPFASGNTMNPFTTTGSGVNSNTIEGTFNYYISCPSTPQCRTQITLNIAPIHEVDDLVICAGEPAVLSALNSCLPSSTNIPPGTTFNQGELTANSPRWGRNTGGTICNGTATPSQYYDVFTFQVSVAGSYTFDMCSSVDAHASLYQNAFNPAVPCDVPANFIIANDDGNGTNCSLDPRITANLVPGVTYFLVSTTLSNNVTTPFSWNYSTTAPGGQIMSNVGNPGDLQWYSALTNGNLLATADTYNPFPVANYGSITAPTTYTYYVACSNNTVCRSPVNLTINPLPQAPTSIAGGDAICHGTSTQLSVVGGALPMGAQWTWYEGSCNGTPIGTGQSINITPNGPTNYYVNVTGAECGSSNCVSTTVTLPTPGNQLGNNNESATCLVNQNGYVHFYHSSGRLIASINSFGQNLGQVTATVYTGNPVDMDACDNPTYMTTAMGRHWVVTPEFQPSTPIDVVLPFYDSELNTLIPAANSNISDWDNIGSINDLLLSKYSGPNNVDDLAWNNCPDFGGNGGTTIHNQVANGLMNTIIPSITATSFFTRHNIPSFSELWLHGATTLSPLGATVVEFESKCEGPQTTVSWSSIQENQCDYYVIEQSVDGINWQTIFQTNCQNETEQINRYQFHVNKQQDLNYYRLWEFNLYGVPTLKGIITDNCPANNSELQLYPNPTTGIFHLTIPMQEGDTDAMIEITDANGKVLFSQNQELVKGNNNATFDMNYLPNGTYLVGVISQKKIFEIQKLIIHH